MYEIVATPTFKISLHRLIDFLGRKYSPQFATTAKANIRAAIEKHLVTNPHIAPISSRLMDLGIRDFHQYAIDEHNLIFYRINEERKQIKLLAVMDARQNIQTLLSELMLRL